MCEGQRVIVSRVDSALGSVINGLRGTIVRWDRQRQQWKVALDSGRAVWLSRSCLFSPSYLSPAPSAEPPSEPPIVDQSGRPCKRPRQALAITVPAAGSDSEGFGSSMDSSGEDEEALTYAHRAAGMRNSRAGRVERRVMGRQRHRADDELPTPAAPATNAARDGARTTPEEVWVAIESTASNPVRLDKGTRVSIYWVGDRRWYCGQVRGYGQRGHLIHYDDNDRKWEQLDELTCKRLVSATVAPNPAPIMKETATSGPAHNSVEDAVDSSHLSPNANPTNQVEDAVDSSGDELALTQWATFKSRSPCKKGVVGAGATSQDGDGASASHAGGEATVKVETMEDGHHGASASPTSHEAAVKTETMGDPHGAPQWSPSEPLHLTKGTRVKIYWDEDDEWYCGRVAGCGQRGHFIRYDDGDRKWERLEEMQWVQLASDETHPQL